MTEKENATEGDLEGASDGTGWIAENWRLAAAGSAAGLGTAYWFLADRLGGEED